MGLRPGEKIEKLGEIRVVSVRRERVDDIFNQESDLHREGFPELCPAGFVEMFCREMHCKPDQVITRIEFEYV